MNEPTNHTQQSKPLELGDFVCPRYMANTAEQAIDRGFVYQLVEIKGTILTVQRVSDPRSKISASSDFFISLQEEEGDADNEADNEADNDNVGVSKEQLRLTVLRMKLMRNRRKK
ncbi:hypothetical protein QUB00_20520 [Microcoleus sp. F8_C2]